jgi:micrococcal nuclease
MKKFFTTALFLLQLFLPPCLHSTFAGVSFAGEKSSENWIKVTKVVDGDTIDLKGHLKVRLIGIDTPEVHESEKLYEDARRSHQDIKTIRALGKRSWDITKKLLTGQKVRLEYGQEREDRYGRTLAYVYFKMKEDRFDKIMGESFPKGQKPQENEYMLNRVLVQYGYANAYVKYPFRYSEEFRGLERKAREKHLGLW